MPGAFSPSFNGDQDILVSKLAASGNTLLFSTYPGGTAFDTIGSSTTHIVVDSVGNSYVTGGTASSDFPTRRAFDTTIGGSFDSFLTKIDPTGSNILFSSFLGGSLNEGGTGIAVDAQGDVYVTGNTSSPAFPTSDDAFDNSKNGSPNDTNAQDAFVSKISFAVIEVDIDIKPGSETNAINPVSQPLAVM